MLQDECKRANEVVSRLLASREELIGKILFYSIYILYYYIYTIFIFSY